MLIWAMFPQLERQQHNLKPSPSRNLQHWQLKQIQAFSNPAILQFSLVTFPRIWTIIVVSCEFTNHYSPRSKMLSSRCMLPNSLPCFWLKRFRHVPHKSVFSCQEAPNKLFAAYAGLWWNINKIHWLTNMFLLLK